jgi:hypothetical protein
MKGEVVKLDKEDGDEDDKYYTIKREDGKMKKMAPEELTKIDESAEIDEAMFPGTKEYEKKFGQSPQQKLKKVGDTEKTAQGEMKKTEKGVQHSRRFSEMLETYKDGGLKTIADMLVKEEPDNEEFTKEVEEVKKKASEKKSPEDEARVAKGSVEAVKNEETEIAVVNADAANGVEMVDIEEGARETQKRASELADKLRKKDPEKSKMYQNLAIKANRRSNNPTGVAAKSTIGSGNKALRRQGIEPVPSPMSSDRMRGYFEETELDEREMTDAEMKKREEYVKGMKKKMPGFKQRYGERAKEVMYATAAKMAKKD